MLKGLKDGDVLKVEGIDSKQKIYTLKNVKTGKRFSFFWDQIDLWVNNPKNPGKAKDLNRIDLIENFNVKEAQFINKVKTKFEPPEDLFSKGSAKKIADVISRGVDLKTAMSRLNFFLNRGGDKLSPEIRSKVEKAKEIVRKKFKRNEG